MTRDMPADVPGAFYTVVRLAGRFWVWFLFKSVDVHDAERVPAQGPVLLCINHPNNLIDSLLVGAVVPRRVHYLATAALFRNPLLARFLRAMGAIPVYRREDDPDKMERNVAAFEACLTALAAGRLVAIYPEGTTHAEARVQRIKTGAARIALAYELRHPGELRLVPVGLSFEVRKSFRGRVLVAFGAPVPVSAYVSAYREDPAKAVTALTAAIQWAMEAEVVHVERIEETELVRAVEELYRGELIEELRRERGLALRSVDPFRLSRTIVDAVTYFKTREPERVERIWRRIRAYRAMLAAYRVRDETLRGVTHPVGARRARRIVEAIAGLPVFVWGLAGSGLPYAIPRWIARRVASKETDYATVRLLSSIVAFPLFWSLEVWIVWAAFGDRTALVFALTLPVTGLLAFRYRAGAARLRHELTFLRLSLTRRQTARRMLAERRELLVELERAKTDYLAATRGSSF